MMIRTKSHIQGFSRYMRTGKKKESDLTRDEKDEVTVLNGNLAVFEMYENFCIKNPKFTGKNYSHTTLSFTEEEWSELELLSDGDRKTRMQEMVNDVIKYHTMGWSAKEVIAYSELHYPKIKFELNKDTGEMEKRYPHIHLAIMNYNPINNTRLLTTSFELEESEAFKQTIYDKYNLQNPMEHLRDTHEKPYLSKIGSNRKEMIKSLENIKNKDELLNFFNENSLNFKFVETKKNQYFKVIFENEQDINLRGPGFYHLDFSNFYKNSEEQLKPKPKLSNHELLQLSEKKQTDKVWKSLSLKNKQRFQNAILEKKYHSTFDIDLTGYYINTKEDTQIKNTKKDIDISDKNNKIISNQKTDNIDNEVALMINLADAKGFNLDKLSIKGTDEFKLKVQEKIQSYKAKKVRNESILKQQLKEVAEKNEAKKLQSRMILGDIKSSINRDLVFNYIEKNFNVDLSKYEKADNNKINVKSNRQKPKNAIDFLIKEFALSTRESIDILTKIYTHQKINMIDEIAPTIITPPTPKRVNSAKSEPIPKQGTKNDKNLHTKRDRRNEQNLYISNLGKNYSKINKRRDEPVEIHNMSELSSIELVHDAERDEMLLFGNELNDIQQQAEEPTSNLLRHTDSRTGNNEKQVEEIDEYGCPEVQTSKIIDDFAKKFNKQKQTIGLKI